jgi:hypothetical protein
VTRADDNSRSGASATTTTAPAVPEARDKSEIEDAYRSYIAMLTRLAEAPDLDDPEIPRRATGAAADDLRSAIATSIADGTIIRSGPTTSQTILSIEVSDDEATLRACFVDESGAYRAATGDEVRPMAINTSVDNVRLQRVSGRWLVSVRELPGPDESWEGTSTCAQ